MNVDTELDLLGQIHADFAAAGLPETACVSACKAKVLSGRAARGTELSAVATKTTSPLILGNVHNTHAPNIHFAASLRFLAQAVQQERFELRNNLALATPCFSVRFEKRTFGHEVKRPPGDFYCGTYEEN
jgi:hypothetical protein